MNKSPKMFKFSKLLLNKQIKEANNPHATMIMLTLVLSELKIIKDYLKVRVQAQDLQFNLIKG